ncbi:MAG: glycosyltransferase [Planctomycetes bacterium]|nr:glycosyltransferase [Planctomycetota bacterium]
MRIVLSGGGTGGHLMPGLALAEALRSRGAEVSWLCGTRPMERAFLERSGLPHECLAMRGSRGALCPGVLRAASRALARWGARAVVGLGGYAAFPGCLAGIARRLPLFLLEQNALPGKVTRLLAPFARSTFLTHPSRWHLPRSSVTGAPLRRPPSPRRLEGAGRQVLVLGGSLGSREVNTMFLGGLDRISRAVGGLRVLHQTGEADLERVREAYARAGVPAEVFASRPDILDWLAGSDAVVARAGGNSLAEILAYGPPAVLLPLASAADGHQEENARVPALRGAAVVLGNGGRTPGGLAPVGLGPVGLAMALEGMLSDPPSADRMRRAARALAITDGTERIAGTILAGIA